MTRRRWLEPAADRAAATSNGCPRNLRHCEVSSHPGSSLLGIAAVADGAVTIARPAPRGVELAVDAGEHLRADELRIALTRGFDADPSAVGAPSTGATVVTRVVHAGEARGTRQTSDPAACRQAGTSRHDDSAAAALTLGSRTDRRIPVGAQSAGAQGLYAVAIFPAEWRHEVLARGVRPFRG
jgi:hypothetical protein